MKEGYASGAVVILIIALFFNTQSMAAVLVNSPEDGSMDLSFDRIRNFTPNDGLPFFETAIEDKGYTEIPYSAQQTIRKCDDPQFEYMAASPYYMVFFKGTAMRMNIKGASIEIQLLEQNLGQIQNAAGIADENSLFISNVAESVDLSFTVEPSLLKEAITLKDGKQVDRIRLGILWEGVIPEFQEDGSILFVDENGNEILTILPPFMEDAEGFVCTDIHYELVETEWGHELHKVIDEKGLTWLEKAVYPVVIDPFMQPFEDAWESSGLTPYGQYFQNLNEYVNPANGHLTITNTDLVIPGRGLDLVISRIYETPAVFYQGEPYDYVAPPVNIGKGWKLDFPYIGDGYFYYWGGTVYKIKWIGNTFENHTGTHFVLVKNGDATYTLTMANGHVCEFDTSGRLTHYKDIDLNTITFYYTSGVLSSITDTIGRTVTFTYSDGKLQKIIYNTAELEYGYNGNGNLTWMEDFLNRRTNFYYNAGWYEWFDYGPGYSQKANVYLLSKIVYLTDGFTTYAYDRFSYEDVYGDDGTCLDYFKYYVTDQRVYETNQVRHTGYTFNGNFTQITSCTMTVKNESDITKGSYQYSMNSSGLVYEKIINNASGTALRKYIYTYDSRKELIREDAYNDGSTLSYTKYYAFDNWGNVIYYKNAEGHEQFFSYANTSTSGFFIDNTGAVIRSFADAFATSAVPSSVHTALLGTAEKQDNTFVREAYLTYDSEAHLTQGENVFGNVTTWLTFSGTFNEKTGSTSFPIDLTGHTVTGNAVLQITGLPSDDTYQESHSYGCPCNPTIKCTWTSGSWSARYYSVHWLYCEPVFPPECDDGWASIGPFIHYPGTLGYQSYSTTPTLGGKSNTFAVTTNWKAYPAQVQYNIDGSWETITTNLQNATVTAPVTITGGSHTLYFSESSTKNTKFSWFLYIPVDNSPSTYTTTLTYDTYGNITSVTDAESNTVSFTYSATYSSAYLTEISATVGTDTITTKALYDYYRGWITSIQQPKGVQAGSGHDTLYTYDILGRIIKKEFPLLPGQYERACVEAIYDCENQTVTTIDPLGHYTVREFDKLGRPTSISWYTGTFNTGTLYATTSYTYDYSDHVETIQDPGNHTKTHAYDFLGRITHIVFPDSSSGSFSYDDTVNKMIYTNSRGYDKISWFDWLSRLTQVEEEYSTDLFTVTTYQYDEVNHLISFTDAETRTTTYTYASLFGMTRVMYPDSGYEDYVYDNMGNITSYIDAKGNETQFLYDALYRPIHIEYQDQSTVSFTYDLDSNRIRMDDNTPNQGDYVEYGYDTWNRLITETRYSENMYRVSYQYDAANRLTVLTYPDNMQILYFYDDLNRIIEIKRYIDGSNDEILMDNVHYNTESLLTQYDCGNNVRTTFSHDLMDRVSTCDVNGETPYLDLDYTYDTRGNITQIINGWRDTSSNWHAQIESYSYDGLDRLVSASCTSWSHTYVYDKAGNRISKDGVTYTVNAVNELTQLSDGTSFTYDENGNMVSKTTGTDYWDYTYDYSNRLTRVEKNQEITAQYIYDGDGRRIQATEQGQTVKYIYSGLNVIYEENMMGTSTYIYGPTGILAKRTTVQGESSIFYYHTNHLGSIRLVTDSSKTIVASITYHPFGETSIEEGSEHHLYTGKEKDATQLYYYGFRYYDCEIGRFTTRDLIAGKRTTPQSLNLYTYCLNNPVNLIDPVGLAVTMCNEDTGVCVTYCEFGCDNEWVAYNSEGKIIASSSEIEELLQEGKFLDAIVLILRVLGYNMDIRILTSVTGMGFITFEYEGVTIEIRAHEIESVLGGTTQQPRPGTTVKIKINVQSDMSASDLFHRVGHEMVHAKNRISEKYWENVETWGSGVASHLDEVDAYSWNLSQTDFICYPGSYRKFSYWLSYYIYRAEKGKRPS
jgi:RHS repeat-associated protein